MVETKAGTHTCIVCGVRTLPHPESVGFSFVAYRGTTDGICPAHAKQDVLQAHGGNLDHYRAALQAGGFTVVERNLQRIFAPAPGATCTKRVVPREAWGAFHASPCGRKAKTTTKAGEPRCGIHDEAKAEAFAEKARAEAQEKAARLERAAQRQQVMRDALELLQDSKGRVSADLAWNARRDDILARACAARDPSVEAEARATDAIEAGAKPREA